jgi:eukaryotic-like serine/threonine-protein kinase
MLDEAGRVLLTDFGISKVLESGSQLTSTGQVLGTPHYMSPEQCRGGEVDGRADQYSLAVVGFKMLTGKVPFDDDSIHTMIYLHVFETPPRAATLRTDTPPLLDDALFRAMAKAPADRFPSMDAFAAAVWPEQAAAQPILMPGGAVATRFSGPTLRMDGPTTPTPTTPQPLASPIALRVRRRPLAMAALVVVAGIAALEVPRWLRPNAPPPVVTAPDSAAMGTGVPAEASKGALDAAPQPVTSVPTPNAGRPSAPPTPPPAAGRSGFLTVDATPFGTVYVDGREVGDTPVVSYAVGAGRHVVEIRRSGYRTRVDTVQVVPGNTLRYSRALLLQH